MKIRSRLHTKDNEHEDYEVWKSDKLWQTTEKIEDVMVIMLLADAIFPPVTQTQTLYVSP